MAITKSKIDYKLYLVTDRDVLGSRDLVQSVEEAIKGGTTIVQIREKNCSSLDFYKIAMQVKEVTSKYNVPLIINDRLDIALAIKADGLHIGQEDLPLTVARKIVGEDMIIGVSASTLEEAMIAQEQGADYVGIGSVYPTSTKLDAKYLAPDELRRIREAVKIPIVGIGGINEKNVSELMETNIDGVAIVSAILGKEDIRSAAEHLSMLVNK
ncbi:MULTISPECIES: thiamine phosphate synthase [Bacillaceae]|uniref:Thiamine-phosphate synthase n=1 Tax=Gottfriedia luciferensis TaxID=178774 RepID=A0ABX2ZMG5_9BACI|nr:MULTISPECIES: thiamine phosphate synthase [Bacillaceae]ODG90592.1 thiamine-phosphate diphosphorylase [Gottfriedia luciferensis]SFD19312.1 thiamine-phosphate pyrophosphorylase [Bacillus sp. UNCCL81]